VRYTGHVHLPSPALPNEVRRTRCVCGLVRRITLDALDGYVSHDSDDDGATWRAVRHGVNCPRRVTPATREA
jgi:hypothetical protein